MSCLYESINSLTFTVGFLLKNSWCRWAIHIFSFIFLHVLWYAWFGVVKGIWPTKTCHFDAKKELQHRLEKEAALTWGELWPVQTWIQLTDVTRWGFSASSSSSLDLRLRISKICLSQLLHQNCDTLYALLQAYTLLHRHRWVLWRHITTVANVKASLYNSQLQLVLDLFLPIKFKTCMSSQLCSSQSSGVVLFVAACCRFALIWL